MANDKNLQGVYNTLKKEGYTPPEYEQFVKEMQDDNNLQGVYNTLKKEGYTPPEYEQFRTDMFGSAPAEAAPAAPQRKGAAEAASQGRNGAAEAVIDTAFAPEVASSAFVADSVPWKQGEAPKRREFAKSERFAEGDTFSYGGKVYRLEGYDELGLAKVTEMDGDVFTPSGKRIKRVMKVEQVDKGVPYIEDEAWKRQRDDLAQRVTAATGVRRAESFAEGGEAALDKLGRQADYTGSGSVLTDKPREAGYAYNAKSDQLERQYVTPYGDLTTDKDSFERDEAFERATEEVQAQSRLARANELREEIERREKELSTGGGSIGLFGQAYKPQDPEQGRKLDELQRLKGEMRKLQEQYRGYRLGYLQQRLKELSEARVRRSRELREQYKELEHKYGGAKALSEIMASDSEMMAVEASLAKLEDSMRQVENGVAQELNGGEKFWDDFGRGLASEATDFDNWDFGFGNLRTATAMHRVHDKIELGEELTDNERGLLSDEMDYQAVMAQFGDLGRGYRWGSITGQSFSFMKDFWLTGGYAGLGKAALSAGAKAATKIGLKSLVNVAGKGAARLSANKVGNIALKALGATAEDLLVRAPMMTATMQAPKVMAEAIEKHDGSVRYDKESGVYSFENGTSWSNAIWQAGADNTIENMSEMSGERFGAVGRFFGARNLTAAALRATNKEVRQMLYSTSQFLNRAGINGYFGEVGEEYYGQLWRTMMGLDAAKDEYGRNLLFSGQWHGDIWGGMALSVGLTGGGAFAANAGLKYAGDAVDYVNLQQRMRTTGKRAGQALTAEVWNPLKAILDVTDNATMGEIADQVVKNKTLTETQRNAVLDYMEATMVMRGHNLREFVTKPGEAEVAGRRQMSEAYIEGAAIDNFMGRNRALLALNYHGGRLREALGLAADADCAEALKARYGSDDINEIVSGVYADESLDGRQRKAIEDYLTASNRFAGMQQTIKGKIESDIAEQEQFVDDNSDRTDKDNPVLRPAKLEKDGEQVFILSGNVALTSDGTMVDISASDRFIIVRRLDGSVDTIDSADIVSLAVQESAAEAKARMAENTRRSLESQYAREVNGDIPTAEGDAVPVFVVGSDEAVDVTVVSKDWENGELLVEFEDGSQTTVSEDYVQRVAAELRAREYAAEMASSEAESAAEAAEQEQNSAATEADASLQQQSGGFGLEDEVLFGDGVHGRIVDIDRSDVRQPQYMVEYTAADGSVRVAALTEAELSASAAPAEASPTALERNNAGAAEAAEQAQNEAPAPEADASSLQQTEAGSALSRIPVVADAQGRERRQWTAVEPALAWDGIVEEAGDEETAQAFADNRVELAQKALEKAQKMKTKPSEDLGEFKESERQRKEAVAAAQAELETWQRIAGVTAERRAAEAEAARQADLAAQVALEQQQRKAEREAREQALADKASRPGEYAEAMKNWDEPRSVEEHVLRQLSGGGVKLLWESQDGRKGIHAHLFGGESERSKRIAGTEYGARRWLIDDRDGMSVDAYVEQVCREYYNDYENGTDHTQEAMTAVLDVLLHYPTSKDMYLAAKDMRDERAAIENLDDYEAEAAARGWTEEDSALEEAYKKEYGMYSWDWDEMYAKHGAEIDLADEEYEALRVALADAAADSEAAEMDVTEAILAGQTLSDEEVSEINSIFADDERIQFTGAAQDGGGQESVGGQGGAVVRQPGLYGQGRDGAGRPSGSGAQGGADVPAGDSQGSGGRAEAGELDNDRRADSQQPAERQGDLQQGEAGKLDYQLSDEVDEDGSPFVLSSHGNTDFGFIPEKSGLVSAPIKLSLGNSKYGLIHLERRHGDEIRKAGFNSVEDFVEYVANNYSHIREGENSMGEANGTYLLQLEDEHNNTLYIELSTDGSYWGVNSGGVFRKGYGKNKKEVWSASEEQNKQSATDNTLRTEDNTDNPTAPNGTVSNASDGKVNALSSDKQAAGAESLEKEYSDEKLEAMELDELGQLISDTEAALDEEFDKEIEALIEEKESLEGKWHRTPKEGRRIKAIAERLEELDRERREEKLAASERYRNVYRRRMAGQPTIDIFAPAEAAPAAPERNNAGAAEAAERGQKADASSQAQTGLGAAVAAAEAATDTNPTEAQKESGQKGHVQVGSFDIAIENPAGSVRSGHNEATGEDWHNTMHNSYGEIEGTEGKDGDKLDVFLSTDIDSWNGRRVFVIDQYNPDGTFDEHKVMLGFNDKDEAVSDYLANYDRGWNEQRRIVATEVFVEDFEKWVESSHRKTKPFADYVIAQKGKTSEEGAEAAPAAPERNHGAAEAAAQGRNSEGHKSKWVAEEDQDEFAALRAQLRRKLGGQLNVGVDPEVMLLGGRMTYLILKNGARKFADFAKAMIEEIGEAVRPRLKSFYEYTRYSPEVQDAEWAGELSTPQEVAEFDEFNFDKDHIDILATAEGVAARAQIQENTDKVLGEMEEQKNQAALSGDYNKGNEAYNKRHAESEVAHLMARLSADLGIDLSEAAKGTGIIKSNFGANHGYVSFTLPIKGYNPIRVEASFAKLSNGRLLLETINVRRTIENTSDSIISGGSDTKLYSRATTYNELLNGIKEQFKNELSNSTAKETTPAGESGQNQKKGKKKGVSLQEHGASLFDNIDETTQNDNGQKTDMEVGTGQAGGQRQQRQPHTAVGGNESGSETARTAGGTGGGRLGMDTGDNTGRGRGVSGIPEGEPSVAAAGRRNVNNNRAERGTDYAPKSVEARIKANIRAIRLAQELTEAGAQATAEQMKVLRQFSGWGGLGAAFSNAEYSRQLRELLGEEAYEEANLSRHSAYYTPAHIIDTMWDIATAMGFKGGKVLEGSAGIGNILGLMPEGMSERSAIQAVEFDSTTGMILKLLYPDAQVDIKGFEKTQIENGSVDLAITNVPFSTDMHVHDDSGDSDLSRKFRHIHDFCIAKNIRKLREGGIGIFITSNGTLDSSDKLRAWIGKEGNCDVVGAFRLHNQTFGGTPTTSDIIVVRKRVNGRRSAHAIDISSVSAMRSVEYDTGETKKVKGQRVPIVKTLPMIYNSYFAEHPENMGGEMMFNFERGESYRAEARSLFPTHDKDQAKMLQTWAQGFAEMDLEQPEATEDFAVKYDKVGNEVKTGTMVIDSQGRLCVNRNGEARPLSQKPGNKGDGRTYDELISAFNGRKVCGHSRRECLEDYNRIKRALAAVLDYQTTNEGDGGLQPLLDELNAAYDTFVSKYRRFHNDRQGELSWLKNDVDYPSVVALETFSKRRDKEGKEEVSFGKTDIFSRRVVEKETAPSPKNVRDGVLASMYLNGRIDAPYIAEALGISEEEAKRQIVESGLGFENPLTRGLEVSYEYLSGNVREKLRQAQEQNADDRYTPNIRALERVIPLDIPAHSIEFTLGSSWIEPKLYEDFIKERTGVSVKLNNAGGTWAMTVTGGTRNEKNRSAGVYSELVGKTIFGHELMEAALRNVSITVQKSQTRYVGSSRKTETITDKDATQLCANRVNEIRDDFKDWARGRMQADPEMAARIEKVYNERFNNSVPREIPDEFIPKHFGGQVTTMKGEPFSLRPHQAKAVIRGTMQSQILAHEVGTGKTYTLITTAMEMRRLGTARKPMIVVQNATVGQFVESAKALYPNAKVLTLEDADRNAEGRKNFFAKIKYNDWDMIVVPQSVFEKIPDSAERRIQFIQDKIAEKEMVLEQMKADDPDSILVRQAERELEKAEAELAEIAEEAQTKEATKDEKREAKARHNAKAKAEEMLDREVDDIEDFDQMGIDALLVDEAHEYKHLGFETAMQRGVKGVDPSYSKKAQGVYLKCQSVMERSNGRNVIFATGTPISNTAAEIWTFMRYLMPADTMREYDIYYFDDFVRNFGNLQNMLEFSTSGKFKENNRFAGYVNLPELVRIWATVADTVLTREAGAVQDKIPEVEGGKAQDIYLPQTRALRGIMLYVKKELDRYENMSGKEKKANSHIPLVCYGIAKAAAVDARLVQADAEDDPASKTNEAVRQTLRSLSESEGYHGTVAIFADNYRNKHSGFNLYEDIQKKLTAQGVPAEQIVIMTSDMSVKKKLEIFEKVNRGEIRVIMGSTFTLGTGVNIQERLHTLIHVDAPNRPMDYTQRNGRILRQGNLHKEWGIPVRVLRFGVEDSLDVTAYQRLKTKGAIADSVMNGKELMRNAMGTRTLEEVEDVFGDITAQLSGSEYAMLKNQAERELRKYTAKLKAWEADQIYIHNQKRTLAGQNRAAQQIIDEAKAGLSAVERLFGDGAKLKIEVNGTEFAGIEAMGDFIKKHNASIKEAEEGVKSGRVGERVEKTLTIKVGGVPFVVTTTVSRSIGRSQQGDLFNQSQRDMTYSCEALGLKEQPVNGKRLLAALEDIMDNVVTGKDYRERIEAQERVVERNDAQLAAISERDGKPFEFGNELEKAKERVEEYTEKMKAEMAAKEAKYADMDSTVEAATNIEYEADEEEEEEDGNRYRMGDEAASFDERQAAAVANRGTVMPGLNEATVRIVDVPRHGYGNGAILNKAKEAAIERYNTPVENPSKSGPKWKPIPQHYDNHGAEFDYVISPGAVQDVNQHHQKEETDVHVSILDKLHEVINESIEVEEYPDVTKVEGKRTWGNPVNDNVLMHEFVGAVTIEGKTYKVRTIMKEHRQNFPAHPYSYEAIKIDVLDESSNTSTGSKEPAGLTSVAKLLKGVEKSYDEGVKLLEASEKSSEIGYGYSLPDESWGMSMAAEASELEQKGAEIAGRLNTPVRFVEDLSDITDSSADVRRKKRAAKGWYDTATGEVVIVLPNCDNVEDVEATIFHEVVGHKGLRELIGDERFGEFLQQVYEHASAETRAKINALMARNGWNAELATEEYLAQLSERGFADMEAQERGFWSKVREKVLEFLSRLFEGRRLPKSVRLRDEELRYLLWRAYQKRVDGSLVGEAANVVMQERLGVDGLRFRSSADYVERQRTVARAYYEQQVAKSSYVLTEAYQDSMLGLKKFYEAVERGSGEKRRMEDIASFENAYLAENTLSSLNQSEMEAYQRLVMKPVIEAVDRLARNKKDYDLLVDYMMAKHGLERNAYMRQKAVANNERADRDFAGLTGLTVRPNWQDAEAAAQQWVDGYESVHDRADIDNLWAAVNAATKATLLKVHESGILSKEQYDEISQMYDYYIPLRGWAETTSDDVYGYLTGRDGAFSSPIKTAEGRVSKADDPIATIANMAGSAIIQGNRNRMKQRFLNYVLNHPSDLASVNRMWVKYDDVADEWIPVFADIDETDSAAEVERKVADFEQRMEALRQAEPKKYKRGREAAQVPYKVVKGNLKEHQVVVMRGGEHYVVTINGNPRAAQAVNGKTNPDTDTATVIGKVLGSMQWVNRQLSNVYTTRNPDFVVSNFIRDFLYSNTMVWVKESPGYAGLYHLNFGKALGKMTRGLLAKYRNNTLDMNKETERLFYEFMTNGGETGYTMQRDVEAEKKAVAKALKKARRSRLSPAKAWEWLGEKFDNINRSVENCARFAAYMTSRQMGRDVQRSVYDAKEISVNFNKKGAGAKFLGKEKHSMPVDLALGASDLGRVGFVFWNAAIQGTTNFTKNAKRHPVKALTTMGVLFLAGVAMAAFGGDDEDDENAYFNQPEYVRRSNLMFKAGKETWVKIPLPVEYRAIYGLGELLSSVLTGKEEMGEWALAGKVTAQLSQLMPLDFMEGGGGLHAFVPSAVKPVVEVYNNKSWTGLPIYKDTEHNKDMPEWTKAYRSANSELVELAAWCNEWSGGTHREKGAVDINPAKVEYLLRGYLGGYMNVVDKLVKMGETVFGDREYDPRDWLLLNRVATRGDERTAGRKLTNDFFDYRKKAERTKELLQGYSFDTKSGILDMAERVSTIYGGEEYLQMEVYEGFRRQLNIYDEAVKAAPDEETRTELERGRNELRRDVVRAMKAPESYLRENGVDVEKMRRKRIEKLTREYDRREKGGERKVRKAEKLADS